MTEPVKLSRERWEMLVASQPEPHEIKVFGRMVPVSGITLLWPRDTPDCIFLPATYVPETLADAMASGLRASIRRHVGLPPMARA